MADIPRFQHLPLEDPSTQIRLIYVPLIDESLTNGNDLQCKLRTCNLTEVHQKFTAVSYAWGNRANSRTISLNARSFSISDNLWKFLNQISVRKYVPRTVNNSKDRVEVIRWFWIDQICINQSRGNERNHQVKIMGDIYASAERVLVWLGDVASPRIDRFRDDIPDVYDYTGIYGFRNEVARCRYWSRLWVIQEIMLGEEVVVLFGSLAGRWSEVRSMIYDTNLPVPAIVRRKYIPSIMTNKYALHRALELFAMHECEDPRDKIFGLMGIVHEEERIEVDYRKSAPEVYWDTVAAFNARELKEPGRIVELGRDMGVTGQEEVCKGLALEKFQSLFAGKHPVSVFQI